MCYECCKQFRGWCKSFTRAEIYLSVAQAALLTGFIAFLTFLILHFISCSKRDVSPYSKTLINQSTNTVQKDKKSITKSLLTTIHHTLPQNVQCTWEPSQRTDALTHYYYTKYKETTKTTFIYENAEKNNHIKASELFSTDSDGIIDDIRKSLILALVKIKPPLTVEFGCILTIVNHFWTITAASCIESIEEVDSLDSFVMMEGFGEDKPGTVHAVSDINIHPLYQGTNKSYDVAAIKSENSLNAQNMAKLPRILDYILINLGEGLDILGFGKFRGVDENPLSRTVRSVTVNVVPLNKCEWEETWSLRHLSRGEAVSRAGSGAAAAGPVCAAPRAGVRARGACNYCAGAPLLRGHVLLAVMADNRHCGLACEPNLYVNLAVTRDWLDSVMRLE